MSSSNSGLPKWGRFCPPEDIRQGWKPLFGCPSSGGRAALEARDAAEHPAVKGTALGNTNDEGPMVHGAQGQKPWLGVFLNLLFHYCP